MKFLKIKQKFKKINLRKIFNKIGDDFAFHGTMLVAWLAGILAGKNSGMDFHIAFTLLFISLSVIQYNWDKIKYKKKDLK